MLIFDCQTVKANCETFDFKIQAFSIHDVLEELIANNVLDGDEVKFTVVKS